MELKNKVTRLLAYCILLGFGIFCFLVFIPRKYDVPAALVRGSTQYWNLSTGSRIGYTLVKGKNAKKTFPIIYLHGGPGGPILGEG